ncbi:MAG TPA: PA14 domain-containing protein, partial [Polyangiaceae bacterium]
MIRRNLLDVAEAGSRPVRNTDVGQVCRPYLDFTGNLAIVGTPVIDLSSNTLYVVSRVREPTAFVQRLHAIDASTFADRPNSPVVIRAQVRGTGAGSLDGVIAFDSEIHNQRAALLLAAGNVYIAWASHCDTGPYHGWIVGYDAVTLQQSFVFNDTVDGALGGIWQAGQGLSADAEGRIYFLTGNGTSNAQFGGRSFGSAFVKLDPRQAEPVVDWFMPYNVDILNDNDADLGSSGALLLPGTNLLLGGGKEGTFYLIDRDRLGHFGSDGDSQIVQSFHATAGHIHGSPVYWNGEGIGPTVYVWSESDYLKAFNFNGRWFDTTPTTSNMRVPDGMPGGMLSISANAGIAGSGVVWASHPTRGDANHATRQGTLRAFDAEDVSRELWNSDMNFARDHVGNFAKFATPVVANGKVYLSTFSDELAVYGLLSSTGTGLLAEYFHDANLSQTSFIRIDASVNFDWRDQSPAHSLGSENFSVRWRGTVVPQFSEEYTFITTSDDGVRLWIDGALVIDAWTDHARREDHGRVTLLAGVKFDVRMEFYEHSGDAVVQLAWSSPSQPTAVIPKTRLFPAAGPG